MVEGHQCHRVAHAHRRLLVGRAFRATSPNGRFVDGARAIDGKPLSRIEVHGKNLFYFFDERVTPAGDRSAEIVHIHFGMSGAFRTMPLAQEAERPPRETTRLRLEHGESGVVAHLSAMTVAHGGFDLYLSRAAKLGPDPLREDADPEPLWAKVQKCKKPIGLVLMDQSMMAGVGNIYRAEILFKAAIHPEQPAHTLSRQAFDSVWAHSVDLLQRGFASGSILTVDPEDAKVLGKPWTRRYIYNHSQCGRCKGAVKSWDMANRTVYCCTTCQPLLEGTEVTPQRLASMAAAKTAKEFVSHCAPDDAGDAPPSKLTVPLLKAALKSLNLDTAGNKAALISRLEAARDWAAGAAAGASGSGGAAAKTEADAAGPSEVGGNEEWHKLAAMEFSGSEDEDEDDHEVKEEAAEAAAPAPVTPAGAPRTPAARKRARAAAGAPAPFGQPAKEEGGAPEAAEEDEEGGSGDAVDVAERQLSERLAGAVTPAAAAAPQPPTTVLQLKASLRALGLPTSGSKQQLAARLAAAAAASASAPAAAAPAAASGRAARGAAKPTAVKPGTSGLGRVATAAEAAREKLLAGESRAVEHVALEADEEADALLGAAPAAAAAPAPAAPAPKRRRRASA